MSKFRIITNGHFYRAQVRTFLLFWVDLNHNGYRDWNRYLVSESWMASSYIRTFKERAAALDEQRGGSWKVLGDS